VALKEGRKEGGKEGREGGRKKYGKMFKSRKEG
jgi:hypothetical protein